MEGERSSAQSRASSASCANRAHRGAKAEILAALHRSGISTPEAESSACERCGGGGPQQRLGVTARDRAEQPFLSFPPLR